MNSGQIQSDPERSRRRSRPRDRAGRPSEERSRAIPASWHARRARATCGTCTAIENFLNALCHAPRPKLPSLSPAGVIPTPHDPIPGHTAPATRPTPCCAVVLQKGAASSLPALQAAVHLRAPAHVESARRHVSRPRRRTAPRRAAPRRATPERAACPMSSSPLLTPAPINFATPSPLRLLPWHHFRERVVDYGTISKKAGGGDHSMGGGMHLALLGQHALCRQRSPTICSVATSDCLSVHTADT